MENLQTEELITAMAFVTLFVGYLAYQIHNRQNKLKLVDEEIRDFYLKKGRKVLSISKLSMAERLKYGVPMSPYISFYYSTFSFFRMENQSVCRSVESVDETSKEYISYVEVSFSGNDGMAVNEFEVYEF
jgi:hypothetical protein